MMRSAAASEDVEGLLDDDVLAGVEGCHGAVGVQAARRADRHGVDVVAAQYRAEVGGGQGYAEPVGQRLCLRLVGVDDGDELGFVQAGQLRRVDAADEAGADQREPQLLGAHR